MKSQSNWDWNLTETRSIYEIQTFSLSSLEVSFAVYGSDLEEFLLFLMSFHIKGTLRHCPACYNKSKNMPKLLAALFMFKIKGHNSKLFVLQAHKSQCNISQIWRQHHLHYSIKLVISNLSFFISYALTITFCKRVSEKPSKNHSRYYSLHTYQFLIIKILYSKTSPAS